MASFTEHLYSTQQQTPVVQDPQAEFERLERLLRSIPIPDRDTRKLRRGSAGEFMLMTTFNPAVTAFKSINSRNYLFVRSTPTGDALDIPVSNEPFYRGVF